MSEWEKPWWWHPPIEVGRWEYPTPPSWRMTQTVDSKNQAWESLRQFYRKMGGCCT